MVYNIYCSTHRLGDGLQGVESDRIPTLLDAGDVGVLESTPCPQLPLGNASAMDAQFVSPFHMFAQVSYALAYARALLFDVDGLLNDG